MRVALESFRGMAPRIAPHLLSPNAAQLAINCRLQSGNLEAWRQFLEVERFAIAPRSVYLLNDRWMAWSSDVDVARSPIPGDQSFTVYLTGPDEYAQPRWTNYALAFQSPGGTAPVVTRPIGVPSNDEAPTLTVGVDSTPTSFSIDTTDDNASLATDWTTNSPLLGTTYAAVTQGTGHYVSKYDENRDPGTEAYAFRNFGVAGVSVLQASCDILFAGDTSIRQAVLIVGANLIGSGVGILYQQGFLQIRKYSAWGAEFNKAILSSVAVSPGLSAGVTYSLRGNVVTNADGTKTVTASVYDGTTELATLTATNNFDDGDFCGFANGISDDAGTQYETRYSNYHVQASGSTNATVVNVATSYVYTLVNDLGEESAPSLPSATVLRPDGVSVTVTTPVSLPTGISADYFIETKRIYRAATGAAGSIFRFVAEIPLATADYVDTLTDAQLGEALESEGWDLPPDDLQGILALPNGIMVGFRRNQICFSAQNRPHAWPPLYRLNTDTDVVGIGAIDTTVVIGTKSFPYVAQGRTPADYSAAKLEVPQACVSKRSIAYLAGVGVCMASPDGYMAIVGVAPPVNLTRGVFTRKQWEALDPTTITGVAHDDVLHFFWDDGADVGGYALDAKPDGFGIIQLAYHATAVHADPVTDNLYLVLDENDEPATPYLPGTSTAPVPDGQTLYQFDGDPSSLMTYLWRGRLNLVEQPYAPAFHRVQGGDFARLIARAYQDGNVMFERVITDNVEFRGGRRDLAEVSFEQELIGTSRVRVFESAEDISEIGG